MHLISLPSECVYTYNQQTQLSPKKHCICHIQMHLVQVVKFWWRHMQSTISVTLVQFIPYCMTALGDYLNQYQRSRQCDTWHLGKYRKWISFISYDMITIKHIDYIFLKYQSSCFVRETCACVLCHFYKLLIITLTRYDLVTHMSA